MNQNLFSPLINLCILLIFFLLSLPSAESSSPPSAVDPQYKACSVPKTCGDQIISYPFFIQGQQEPFCGYPGFHLSCHENKYPIVQIFGNDYIIRNISYQNQSLVVSNAVFSDLHKSSACNNIPVVHNLSFPNDQFKLAQNQTELVLLYNCSSSLVESLSEYKIGCFKGTNKNSSVLALPRDDVRFGNAYEKCGRDPVVVAAPVERYGNGNGSGAGIEEVLRKGFVLEWIAGNCSRCEQSGGRCGFNHTTYHFKCFCPDRPHSGRCNVTGDEKLGLKLKLALGIAGGFILTVLVVTACGLRRKLSSNRFIFFPKKENQDRQAVEAFLVNNGPLQVKRYSYLEIKQMTNSFKETLGQGGYGGVYKGTLTDGRLVAVKVLNKSKGNGEEFMNEVAAISRTSHVNIVSLLGFCFEGSEKALIYEFMPNGSLEKFIFDANNPQKDVHLGWETLERISLGIAQGLEYLHRGCNTRILHFDIKPHNILLDENFSPKISDFGLAKICNRKESIVSMLGARGTAGYIAPEVFCRNFGGVSHKSDVYSYGMMLSEMVGGRRNIDAEAEDTSEIYFPHWIYRRIELDEELGLQSIMNEEDKARARKMIIVSLWCIQTDPSNRPAMREVIDMLEGSVDSLQIPPKPYLSSPPPNPLLADSSTTMVSVSLQ